MNKFSRFNLHYICNNKCENLNRHFQTKEITDDEIFEMQLPLLHHRKFQPLLNREREENIKKSKNVPNKSPRAVKYGIAAQSGSTSIDHKKATSN